jgi:soluble lytic murein transglycosylase-like protein
MDVRGAAAILIIAVGASASPPSPSSAAQTRATQPARDIALLELASVRRLFDALARQRESADEGERVAAWSEFSLLAEAVVGQDRVGALAFDDLAAAATTGQGPRVPATPAVLARDTVAYQLLSLAYSARETSDVITGRITKQALDNAQKMLLVGRGKEAAANYLDSQYKRLLVMRTPPAEPNARRGAPSSPFEAFIDKYARLHAVDAAIVRAVMAVESAFDPAARSPAGALGLMQLMPGTARALGVDPLVPEQNIEGGVRYLSELMKMFGGLELALVAYNGGPGFARRYQRGETPLYGETRNYVRRVLGRLGILR